MFYEECVIDGILHYRGTPRSEWVPMSKRDMTETILGLRAEIARLRGAEVGHD